MKNAVLGFALAMLALVVFVSIGSVFEYSSTYRNLSFDLRHAIMESGKEAIIPEINYVMVDCDEDELEEDYCDINGQKEIEEIIYMDQDEYFSLLLKYLGNTKKVKNKVHVELLYFTNHPFLAHVRVRTTLHGMFIEREIVLEEAVIET